MKNVTVSSLRSQGLRVFVRHMRYFRFGLSLNNSVNVIIPVANDDPVTRSQIREMVEQFNTNTSIVYFETLSRGGRTEVEIYNGEELIGTGIANCSLKDAYNKKIGRSIALGRAVDCMNNRGTCNWTELLEEVGVENVRRFVSRQMTSRQFESLSSTGRKLIRELGTEAVRTRARQALSRRSLV